jgi:NADPH:quinone reductase-like Zn-dependent oxidoreductase
MKAMVYRRFGPPDVLELAELPEPEIKPHELLVRVGAVGVNPVDWKLRSGHPKIPGGFPRIPGSDLAGEVVRVGAAVTKFKPGDAVYGMLSPFRGGALAEYAALPERHAAKQPENLSVEEAAAAPVAGMTALQVLRDVGRVKAGDRVLINGASGGVGSFAVQIAKAFGAHVTAVTSGGNIGWVRELGADDAIDYIRDDFTRSGERYDLIFDTVSTRSFSECRPILTSRGIYVATLPSPGRVFYRILTALPFGKRARIVTLRNRAADLEALRGLIEADKVRPAIDHVFPLAQAAEAHAASESGRARGKIVIRIPNSGTPY